MTLHGALGMIIFAYGVITLFGHCSGLKCKSGEAMYVTGYLPYINETTEQCKFDKRYCLVAYCFAEGNPAFAITYWQCHWTKKEEFCPIFFQNVLKNELNLTNSHCTCEYGKPNEDMANDKSPARLTTVPTPTTVPTLTTVPTPMTVPPMPIMNCLIGHYDHNGYGKVENGTCNKEDKFCFVASCASVTNCTDKKSMMVWSCAISNDCVAIAARFPGDKYLCQCQFGEQGVNFGNEKRRLPLAMPTQCFASETPLRCLLLEFACKKFEKLFEHANNAKAGRRFKPKENCQKVKERVENMAKRQMELLGNDYFNYGKEMFLEDFVP